MSGGAACLQGRAEEGYGRLWPGPSEADGDRGRAPEVGRGRELEDRGPPTWRPGNFLLHL